MSQAACGYDAGKEFNGCKCHLVVDIRGLLLVVMVTRAELHDLAAVEEASSAGA